MSDRMKENADPSLIKRMLAAEEESAEHLFVPYIRKLNSAGASTAPDVMKHMPTGAGAATQRSGKGGKSGGGMGGQQAGGIKGRRQTEDSCGQEVAWMLLANLL